MKCAIYSRKSKFTGKGDSIENQIQLCKAYLHQKYELNDEDIFIYEDEGFSGSHTERPAFQKMLLDARHQHFQALICYRIDRVSRNVADFSKLIQLLEEYHIHFISISELFDTSTPMGRTMLYIISAFAQLERETIAERIRDNMLHLAKSGRWLGGVTPTGFTSSEQIYLDTQGKERKFFQLTPIPEEVILVKTLYKYFLQLKSLSALESYLHTQGIYSKNNRPFSRVSLKNILHNPVYVTADSHLLSYLKAHHYNVHSPNHFFDGNHGLMAYNKTIQSKHVHHVARDPKDWVIAVGQHPGIISSEDWIATQSLLETNHSKSYQRGNGDLGILSGLLRCEACGHYMRPKCGRISKSGTKLFYYICEEKEKSHGKNCNTKNIQGNQADQDILDALSHLSYSPHLIARNLNPSHFANAHHDSYESLLSQLNRYNTQIKQLLQSLSQTDQPNVQSLILNQINELDMQKKILESDIQKLDTAPLSSKLIEPDVWLENFLENLTSSIQILPPKEQKKLIRPLIDCIYWDGTDLKIHLLGSNQEKD